MKRWHKVVLVLVIIVAVILAVKYRRSNYESPESIVTAMPGSAPPSAQGGIPPGASILESSPTTVIPSQMPQAPVESVVLPEQAPVVQSDFQDVNLPLTPIVAVSGRGVRAYDLDMVDTNEPLMSDDSIPGLTYGTPPPLLSLGVPTESPPDEQEQAYTGKSMYTELNVDSE
jgi:hypothetical protein